MNIKVTPFIVRNITLISLAMVATGCVNTAQFNNGHVNNEKSEFIDCVAVTKKQSWHDQYKSFVNTHPYATINKPVDLCEKRDVLYVKMHNHSSVSSAYFEDAVMVALQDNDLFRKVVTRQPTVYINVEPYSPQRLEDKRYWYDTDDPLTIAQIKKLYPEPGLLIMEVWLQEFATTSALAKNTNVTKPVGMTVNLIDPTDGSTIVFSQNSSNIGYYRQGMRSVSMVDAFTHWFDAVAASCVMLKEKRVVKVEAEGNVEVDVEIEKAKKTSRKTTKAPSVLPSTVIVDV